MLKQDALFVVCVTLNITKMKGKKMTLKELHNQMKEKMPLAGVIQCTHCIIDNICGEHFGAMIYAKGTEFDDIDRVMFQVHLCKSPEQVLDEALSRYNSINPEEQRKREIEKLKKELARLEAI